MAIFIPIDYNEEESEFIQKKVPQKKTKRTPKNIIKLIPDFNVLNKYFDYGEYDSRQHCFKPIKTKDGILCKSIQDVCDMRSEFLKQPVIDNLKLLFEKYNLLEHIDNLFFESIIFLHSHWYYHVLVCDNVDVKTDNFELRLMKFFVKYSVQKNDLDESKTCSLVLNFIKKNKTEKFVIPNEYFFGFTNYLLNKIRERMVIMSKHLFHAELFPPYWIPQDKTKQMEFIEKNLIQIKKGRKNKNLIFAKFIIGMVNYLNNETSFKAKENKIISNKHAVFIYDFISQLMFDIDPDKPIEKYKGELINEEKSALIRDIVSNYNKNI